MSLSWNALIRSVLMALGVAAILFAALLGASYAAAGVDREVYRERAREAIASGALSRPMLVLPGGTPHLQYKPLDCLILTMLTLEPVEAQSRAALSPRVPLDDRPPPNRLGLPDDKMCRNLAVSLGNPAVEAGYYHRYMHGHWIVAASLLPMMSFDAITTGLLGVYVLVLGVVAVVALRRLTAGEARARNAAFSAITLGALMFTGINNFGWSIAFILSDLTAAMFLAYCYFRAPGSQRSGEWITLTAAFGALTAAFEFLNGAVPVAVALVLVLASLDESRWTGERTRRLAGGIAAFAIGFVAIFLCKAIAVALVWGSGEIAAAGGRLGTWMVHDNWTTSPSNERLLVEHGFASEDFKASRAHAFAFAMAKMAAMSDLIGFGSRGLGLLIVVAGPLIYLAAGGFGLASRPRAQQATPALFLLALGAVLAWHFLFVSHSIVHANFMLRTLGWATAFGCGLSAWLAATRFSRPAEA